MQLQRNNVGKQVAAISFSYLNSHLAENTLFNVPFSISSQCTMSSRGKSSLSIPVCASISSFGLLNKGLEIRLSLSLVSVRLSSLSTSLLRFRRRKEVTRKIVMMIVRSKTPPPAPMINFRFLSKSLESPLEIV